MTFVNKKMTRKCAENDIIAKKLEVIEGFCSFCKTAYNKYKLR